jgi:DNA-binding transcriptional LysR family regulator
MDGLLVLALIAERGSLSAAARELGVAPSAVSKRIAGLEGRLGARLLVRTTRRIALSDDGVRLHAHAAAVLGAWRSANAGDDDRGGIVRINAPGLFAEVVLAPFLTAYRERHPEAYASVSCEDRMIELTNGAFDVVIRVSRDVTRASAVVRALVRDRLVVVAAPAYLVRFGVPRGPAELSAHRCMRYLSRDASEEWRFLVDGRAVSIPIAPAFAAAEDASLRAAAVEGLGLAIMPRLFVKAEVAGGRLVTVLDDALAAPERTVRAVVVEGRLAPVR